MDSFQTAEDAIVTKILELTQAGVVTVDDAAAINQLAEAAVRLRVHTEK